MSAPTVAVRPFSCGTEGADWLTANCARCVLKGDVRESGDSSCPMETAVSRGFITGTVPGDLAAAYGATLIGDDCEMPRQCGRFQNVATTCEYLLGPAQSRSIIRRVLCGKPAVGKFVTNAGYQYAVCEKHP